MTPEQKYLILTNGGIEGTVGKPVVPLYPFLVVKAAVTSDRRLRSRLRAMKNKNLIPNTIPWNEHFKRSGAVLLDKMRSDGRRLVLPEEDQPA